MVSKFNISNGLKISYTSSKIKGYLPPQEIGVAGGQQLAAATAQVPSERKYFVIQVNISNGLKIRYYTH